jgi:hypothetical protein
MDRDRLIVLPGVRADPEEVGLLGRFGRAALPDGLVWRTRRGQAPDPVHDAAIRSHAVSMKGTAPPGVTMRDFYRGMCLCVTLQLVGRWLSIYCPSMILRLPKLAGLLD